MRVLQYIDSLTGTKRSYTEPGKYKPGDGVYFGHRREVIAATYHDYDVLIAEPKSVRWAPMSGRFSKAALYPFQPVEGCHENEGTKLAIVRGQAREHMHVGILTPKTTQLGKGSPKLDCAYIMAGKKEVLVEVMHFCSFSPFLA